MQARARSEAQSTKARNQTQKGQARRGAQRCPRFGNTFCTQICMEVKEIHIQCEIPYFKTCLYKLCITTINSESGSWTPRWSAQFACEQRKKPRVKKQEQEPSRYTNNGVPQVEPKQSRRHKKQESRNKNQIHQGIQTTEFRDNEAPQEELPTTSQHAQNCGTT